MQGGGWGVWGGGWQVAWLLLVILNDQKSYFEKSFGVYILVLFNSFIINFIFINPSCFT